MDVRNNAAASNCGLDKTVKFLVAANSELQMPWGNSFHFEIFTGVTCKLENFSCEVFENCSGVDGSGSSYALLATNTILEMAMDPSNRKLKTGARGT